MRRGVDEEEEGRRRERKEKKWAKSNDTNKRCLKGAFSHSLNIQTDFGPAKNGLCSSEWIINPTHDYTCLKLEADVVLFISLLGIFVGESQPSCHATEPLFMSIPQCPTHPP